MWLLDANLDVHLVAAQNGFDSLLTRDQLSAESASRIWSLHPKFGIVVVMLPRLPFQRCLKAFAQAWAAQPIRPVPGEIVNCP